MVHSCFGLMTNSAIAKYKPSANFDNNELSWYAIYVRFKSEKFVTNLLQKKGIEAYIPLKTAVKRYSRKIKTYHLPLINCYVFVKINGNDRVKVIETENVLKFVKTGDNLGKIPEKEIEILRKITGEFNDQLEIEPSSWVQGNKVEIVRGGLAGTKGYITERKNKKVFLIALENMGFDLILEVEATDLELSK